MKKIAIIGGGASALMLAAQLDTSKYQVQIFEQKKTLGRKFLVAGEGGLNLTYHSPIDDLIDQYIPREFMSPIIHQFTNQDLMTWFESIDIPTFIGSSKRVFPDLKLKPIYVLNKILEIISNKNIDINFDKKWIGWNENGQLIFEGQTCENYDLTVFALGGASWQVTGSDGKWLMPFEAVEITVNPFRAANCAFQVNWDEKFINTHHGKPLKNIAVTYNSQTSSGELSITKFGLEGNAIYALSQNIQTELSKSSKASIFIDLKPTMTVDQIKTKLNSDQHAKMTDTLKETLNLDRPAIGLLKNATSKDTFLNPDLLAAAIKSIPIDILGPDELDKAISSLGGIDLSEIDQNFQLNKIPNTYVIGEMLDWFAPTGGYLLQACFSMGFVLAKHLNSLNLDQLTIR